MRGNLVLKLNFWAGYDVRTYSNGYVKTISTQWFVKMSSAGFY